jgi:hypothetical protein
MDTNISLQDKIKYYEQTFFTYDKPIPFKDNQLLIYPVKITNYYDFYFLISCFTVDKNEDTTGIGIGMSNLDYAFHLMEDETSGKLFTNQFMSLLELIFQIKNGLKCSCSDEVTPYSEIYDQMSLFKTEEDIQNYIENIKLCAHCSQIKKDVIRFKELPNGKKNLMINEIEINKQDYDELRKIVCYYNIPDYDDEYIDPKLKEELEEVAKLQNPNSVQPSLEKQKTCVVTGAPYKYEELDNMTIRRFVLLLRTIDQKLHYFAYRQAEVSGMVSFKNELSHWIYSKKDSKFKDIMSLSSLKEKLKDVT